MHGNKNDTPSGWEELKVLSTVVATIPIPVVIAFVSQSYTKALKDNEIGVKYVEFTVSILKEPPDKTPRHLRKWAIDVVNNHATVPMSDQAIRELESEDLSNIFLHRGSIDAIRDTRSD